MRALEKLYRFANLLSIDVAIGAVCSALFFGKLFKVSILPVGLISLALTVWIIYTLDHLLDARRIKAVASTLRHRFHQQHFQRIIVGVAVAITTDIIIVSFVRPQVFQGGVLLIVLCGLYLLMHQFIRIPKEMLIAVLYTCGVLLPSASVTIFPLREWPVVIIITFMLTAFVNLLIFSWYDRINDKNDRSVSIVLIFGEQNVRSVIWFIVTLNFALLLFAGDLFALTILMAMNAVLMLVFLNEKQLSVNDRFRLLGDAVFFVPLIYLLFP